MTPKTKTTTARQPCPACSAHLPEHLRDAGSFLRSELTRWLGARLCLPCAASAERYRMSGVLPDDTGVCGVKGRLQYSRTPTLYDAPAWQAASFGGRTLWQEAIDALIAEDGQEAARIRAEQGHRIRVAHEAEQVRIAEAKKRSDAEDVQRRLQMQRAQLDEQLKENEQEIAAAGGSQ